MTRGKVLSALSDVSRVPSIKRVAMLRANQLLMAMIVLSLAATADAQFEVPPTPTTGQIQSAVSALANAQGQAAPVVTTPAANVSIYTGNSCPTMWEFLGFDKAAQGMKSAYGVAKRIPLIQNIGNTVIHPVARSAGLMPAPPGGALGAETTPPAAAGGSTAAPAAANNGADQGGMSGAPPGAQAPSPGMPQLPGAPPPAPGPAALLAKISASKAKNKAEIAAITQLQRMDPREYPEIVASLLGKLDDPSEEVRYRALVALREVAAPRHCTRARFASGPCHCEACERNWMSKSLLAEPVVIDRLTDLLLRGSIHSPERKTGGYFSGAPREYSGRIRRLAIEILEGSIRKPRVQGIRRAVPDPKYGEMRAETPKRAPRELQVETPKPKRKEPNRLALSPTTIPVKPVTRSREVSIPFERTPLPDFESRYVHFAERIANNEVASAQPLRSIREAASTFLAAGRSGDIDLNVKVVDLCYEAIKQCTKEQRRDARMQGAFILLTNARLRLAIQGYRDHVLALSQDADAFRQWDAESVAAREAAFAVVRYARAVAERYGASDKRYLSQYAERAIRFATNHGTKPSYAVPHLVAAAELCEQNGLGESERDCVQMLESMTDNELARTALEARLDRTRSDATPQTTNASLRKQPTERPEPESRDEDTVSKQTPGLLQQVAFEQAVPLPQAPPASQPDFVDSLIPDTSEIYEDTDRYAFERSTPSLTSFLSAMKAIDASHQYEAVEGESCMTSGFRSICTERSEYSAFALEAARPANQFRIRFDSARNFASPDRAEYFWAAIGSGGPPAAESSVDFQELRFYSEKSIGSSSAFVEIPFRMLDPDVNSNTAGLGDINMGAKTVLLDNDDYVVSTVFRNYFNSGLDRRGLGRGHFVLEPGILGNYRVGCHTWLRGEMKFLIPLGADADAAGEAITFGAGLTHVLAAAPYHSDDEWGLGAIASLEFQGISLLDGRGTLANGTTRTTDETLLYLYPGIRFLLGEKFDFGFAAAIPLNGPVLYDRMFRTEFRWSF